MGWWSEFGFSWQVRECCRSPASLWLPPWGRMAFVFAFCVCVSITASELWTGLKIANSLNLDISLQVLPDPAYLEANGGCVMWEQVKQPNTGHRRANGERGKNQSEKFYFANSLSAPPPSISYRFTKVRLLTLLPWGVQEAVGSPYVHWPPQKSWQPLPQRADKPMAPGHVS